MAEHSDHHVLTTCLQLNVHAPHPAILSRTVTACLAAATDNVDLKERLRTKTERDTRWREFHLGRRRLVSEAFAAQCEV